MSHPIPVRLSLLSILCAAIAVSFVPSRAGSVLGDDFNQEEQHDYNGMPKWRLVLETGYSQWMYNPDSLSDEYDSFLNEVESGWSYSAELAYFPWPKGGVGLNWIWFLSKAQDAAVAVDSRPAAAPHRLSDRISVIYYGPIFLSRLQFGRFGLLVGGFSAGWLEMHYTMNDDGAPNTVMASSPAVAASVGWEYSFYRLVSFGVNGRLLLSNITEYTYNGDKVKIDQPDDPHHWNNISMTRFELTAGIRFGL
jgi:hypothetical protein